MKYSFAALGIIMAGLIGIVFIGVFQSVTTNNESEYYVLKEAMEASMLESIDLVCYRNNKEEGCGEVIKISEQKFVENFTRRFAQSITGDANEYEILFYDIIESPPKASIAIVGKTKEYALMSDESFDLANALSGILEYKNMITLGTDEYDNTYSPIDVSNPNQTAEEGTLDTTEEAESGEATCVLDNGSECPAGSGNSGFEENGNWDNFNSDYYKNPALDIEGENTTTENQNEDIAIDDDTQNNNSNKNNNWQDWLNKNKN